VTPIPFNRPHASALEIAHVNEAIASRRLCGDGPFTKSVQAFFESRYGYPKTLLTTSCTDALELAALVLRIGPSDEVIVPAFTFVSSANAFALRGAKLVFCDSEASNPNVDPEQIERLITPRTKAIVVVHYAGVCCDMDRIMRIADAAGVAVIEDAAQAIDSTYRGKPAGSFGALAAFSFHETKNISCGEGGLLVVNHDADFHRAEIIREKGTNRSAFIRGEVDRYGWIEVGSSFLPSELNAAFLYGQLEQIDLIQNRRLAIFSLYDELLKDALAELEVGTPEIAPGCSGNAHAYYVVLRSIEERTAVFDAMKRAGVQTASHYASLHKSECFAGKHDRRVLPNSDRYSDCLLRLPLYFGLSDEEARYVAASLLETLRARRPAAVAVGTRSRR
jgi:dTDP-4-amino-4,6-dideoxygalactose transaminase